MTRLHAPPLAATRLALLCLPAALLASTVPVHGADGITPGNLRVDATFEHLGLLWEIAGDDDGDSTFALEFRAQGESVWRPAAPGMRARPGMMVDGAPLGTNTWAASALFLEPGATYELRATLADPDGGGEARIVEATTRSWPAPAAGGARLYVVPGSSGGSGTAADPYRGLQEAADAAQPGDTFIVAPGTYADFELTTGGAPGQPITFLGPADRSAIVDGGGTDRGVVTLGRFDDTLSWVIVSRLVIRNGRWGVDAQNTTDVAILDNVIENVDFGVLNRRGNDLERRQTVCDNTIEGRTPWPGVGIPSERGIDLRGFGNVVCHNRVRNFGDCISLQPLSGPGSFGNDVFGNDVALCVDDGIEIDYNQANVRVWRNRVYNARMGVSTQPIRGGPAYIFRNELFNLESNSVKLNNDPVGLVIVHNTAVKLGNGLTGTSHWRNGLLRNNLVLGTRYAFEFLNAASDGFRDLDYDAWGTSQPEGPPDFKWDDVRYDDLADLQSSTGVELHGVEASFAHLANATLPASDDVAVDPATRDLRLLPGVPEIDAGKVVANLNDPFPLSGPPDLGAFEHGERRPVYGPRPIFADGFESGDTSAWK